MSRLCLYRYRLKGLPKADAECIVCIRGAHVNVLGPGATMLQHHCINVKLGNAARVQQAPAGRQAVLRRRGIHALKSNWPGGRQPPF